MREVNTCLHWRAGVYNMEVGMDTVVCTDGDTCKLPPWKCRYYEKGNQTDCPNYEKNPDLCDITSCAMFSPHSPHNCKKLARNCPLFVPKYYSFSFPWNGEDFPGYPVSIKVEDLPGLRHTLFMCITHIENIAKYDVEKHKQNLGAVFRQLNEIMGRYKDPYAMFEL